MRYIPADLIITLQQLAQSNGGNVWKYVAIIAIIAAVIALLL